MNSQLLIGLDASGHGFRVTGPTGHSINLPINHHGARMMYELLLQLAAGKGNTINLPEAPSQAAVDGVIKVWKGKTKAAELPLDQILERWREEDNGTKEVPLKVRKFNKRGQEMLTLEDLEL